MPTLLSLIGDQTIPNLLPLRYFEPGAPFPSAYPLCAASVDGNPPLGWVLVELKIEE